MGVVTIVATALAAPLITLLGLQGSARDLGIAFAYLCMPQIFFYAAYAIWSQVLNVHGRFGLVMWTPALANVVQIAGMAVFLSRFVAQAPAELWTPGMIWLLAGTSTLGIVVQALLRVAGRALGPVCRHAGEVCQAATEAPEGVSGGRGPSAVRANLGDRKSTRLNSSHPSLSRMPSSACKKKKTNSIQSFSLFTF